MRPEDYRALQAARAQTAALIDDRRRQAAERRQMLGMEPQPPARPAQPPGVGRHVGRSIALSAALVVIVTAALLLVGPLRDQIGR